MRIPPFERFQKVMQLLAFFVCGMIVGSAIYSALQNTVVENLLQDKYKLQEQLDTVRIELGHAQKRQNENVIRSIVIFIEDIQGEPVLDILTQKNLKLAVKKDLTIFIGRSIFTIGSDSQLARNLLEQKIYDDIGDRDYEVSVKTMLAVDGALQVWIEAKEHHQK
jgi:hypothetical protein